MRSGGKLGELTAGTQVKYLCVTDYLAGSGA